MIKFLKFIFITIVIMIVGAVGLFYYVTTVEPSMILVSKETYKLEEGLEDLKGLKIVAFSDTHFNNFANDEKIDKLVEKVNEQEADIILFLGDLIDRPVNNPLTQEHYDNQTYSKALGAMEASIGKYAVLGNHDYQGLYTAQQARDILASGGFTVLTNEVTELWVEGAKIQIFGIDDYKTPGPDLNYMFSQADDNAFKIMIKHDPNFGYDLEPLNFDLGFAGHTHGGQVRIPYVKEIIWGSTAQEGEYVSGAYELSGDKELYVTPGLGNTRMDVRFLAFPEIIVYTLE